jgi:hypothetical protein
MILTSEQILGLTEHGIPAGNYDGSTPDFVSDPRIAANYYAGLGSIQTIFTVLNAFVGRIQLRATLNDNPADPVWFDIGTEMGDGTNLTTGVIPQTIQGNFTYVRADVTDFSSGAITSITINY